MGRDKVVIIIVATIVFSAVLFGIIMAYKSYYMPLKVHSINETIEVLKSSNVDENFRMVKLSLYNELSRSCKMRDATTGEARKFTEDEMKEFYNAIGGKEAVIEYLSNIENETEKRQELEYACYTLKIITSEELDRIWNN